MAPGRPFSEGSYRLVEGKGKFNDHLNSKIFKRGHHHILLQELSNGMKNIRIKFWMKKIQAFEVRRNKY